MHQASLARPRHSHATREYLDSESHNEHYRLRLRNGPQRGEAKQNKHHVDDADKPNGRHATRTQANVNDIQQAKPGVVPSLPAALTNRLS